jgi:hypothetical protein
MSEVSEKSYFYRVIGGSETGPVTLREMADLITLKRVSGINQVRENGCYLWRYASDVPEFNFYQNLSSGSSEPRIESKRLSELTVSDVPKVFEPYFRILTNCGFFLNYVVISLDVIFVAGYWVLISIGLRSLKLPLSGRFMATAAIALVLWAAWVCVAPLIIWMNYHKRRLRWVHFFFAEFAAYIVPSVAVFFGFWIAEYSLWRLLLGTLPRFSSAAL